jgi:hypothetical protein
MVTHLDFVSGVYSFKSLLLREMEKLVMGWMCSPSEEGKKCIQI